MIHRASDLSAEQKMAIESLLGRRISEEEQISIRTLTPQPPPEWLEGMQRDAARKGLDALSMQEIEEEIAAARRDWRGPGLLPGE